MPLDHRLHVDQDITFASLDAAAAAAAERGIEVRLFTAEFGDDARSPRPRRFAPTANLTRHAFETYEMGSRGVALRKLPLIGDVLGLLFDATASLSSPESEECAREGAGPKVLLAFSNADIGVQRDFYSTVAALALKSDAFVINRVEVPDTAADGTQFTAADLDELYRLGRSRPQRHAGYDMFVWRREATRALRVYTRGVFVGYPPVGRHLRDAMSCAVSSFKEVRGTHDTFHVGERNGGWSQFPEYEHYNRKAAKRAEADFNSLLKQRGGCTAVRKHVRDPTLPESRAAECKLRDELATASFRRWDRPGTGWPPDPV